MAETADVVVVGAGVAGCSVAYYLSLAGAKVCILEREAIGCGASTPGAGGISTYGLELKPGPHFLLGCAGENVYPGLIAALGEESKVDTLYQERTCLALYLDEQEEDILRSQVTWQKYFKTDRKWIDGDEARKIEPRLGPQVRGAMVEEHRGQVDGFRLSLAMVEVVEKRGGYVLLRAATGLRKDGDKVTGVLYPGGEVACDSVVIAMGAWSREASDWLQSPIPVRPLKGELLRVRLPGKPIPVLLGTSRHGHMHTRRDGLASIGSTGGASTGGRAWDSLTQWDPDKLWEGEIDSQPTEDARLFLMEHATQIMPAAGEAELVHHLAGPRPNSPDRAPILGPVPGWQGVYAATGYGNKGIHLAPICGKIVADLIAEGKTDVPVPLDAFSLGRFSKQRV